MAACEDQVQPQLLYFVQSFLQVNAVSVTSSHFPNRKTFVEREEFCILVKKLVKSCTKPAKYYVLVKFYPKICEYIYSVRVWLEIGIRLKTGAEFQLSESSKGCWQSKNV